MSKCSIAIILEKKDGLAPADVVRGEAVITAEDDVSWRGVDIQLQWRTHGRGDVDTCVVESVRTSPSDLRAGRTESLPFSFRIPEEGPVTVRGTLLNLDWYVIAKVDLAFAIDPTAEADLVVIARAPVAPFRAAGEAIFDDEPVSNATTRKGATIITLVVLPFLAMGLLCLFPSALATGSWRENLAGGCFQWGFGILLVAGLSTVLVKVWKNAIAHSILDGAEVRASPRSVIAGDELQVRFETPSGSERIESLEAWLLCRERVRYTSGTDTCTATHEALRVPLELGRQPGGFAARARIPSEAPASLATANNAIEWLAVVEVRLRGAASPVYEAGFAVGTPARS